MRKFLIASHGRVASGIKNAAEILRQDVSAITAVDCYVDESDFTPQIQEFIDSVTPTDEAVIFTDLLGGSVCNKVMTLKPEEHGIMHVTGVNLICVLGCLLEDGPLTEESVDRIVSEASGLMQRIQPPLAESSPDSGTEDDFFA